MIPYTRFYINGSDIDKHKMILPLSYKLKAPEFVPANIAMVLPKWIYVGTNWL